MESRAFFETITAGDLERVRAALAEDPDLANAVADPEWVENGVPGFTALHHAGMRGHLPIARALIEAGANLEATAGEKGWPRTALHDSFEYGHGQITALLLESGAFLDVAIAAGLGRIDRLIELLDGKPDLANDASNGLPPLGWAAYGNQAEAVHLLVDRGARVTDELCFAAQCGHVGSGTALLDRGADPNLCLHGGQAPLHYAARMQFTDDAAPFVRLLLERKADPTLRTKAGKTPLDIAQACLAVEQDKGMRRGYEAVISVLGRK